MSFDPYEILSIDRSATTKDIKSAYRKKSLKYHPDKNPDNPTAQATFMLIAKAYEALTDPVAKSNWEKFGNPDGKQSLEISIGLPTFLLSAEWRSIILLTYLFSMVVLLPTVVWYYYNDSSKYGEMGIMYKTWGWLNHSLTGQSEARTVPEVLAGCAEFHEMVMPKDIEGEKVRTYYEGGVYVRRGGHAFERRFAPSVSHNNNNDRLRWPSSSSRSASP